MATAPRSIQQPVSLVGLFYRLVDLASIAGGWVLAERLTSPIAVDYVLATAVAVVAHTLLAEVTGLYRSWRGASTCREVWCTFITWSLALATALALAWAADYPLTGALRQIEAWGAATLVLMIIAHAALRFTRRVLWQRGLNTQPAAIVGVTELGIQLGHNLNAAPELGLKLVGYYDDRPPERNPDVPLGMKPQIGTIADLLADIKAGFVRRIYITFPMRAEDRIRDVLKSLADSPASVYIVPDFFVFQLLHSRWTDIGGLPTVSIFENPLYGIDGAVKRAFDLVVGGLLLVLLGVPMALIALAVRLTSRGPAFFRQRRYGLDGKAILVWKFRSMRVCENGAAVKQATRDDPRITPLGAILRKTSLDELPQLFNVIGGSMSLVGPRPHAAAHNEQYRRLIEGYMLRHKVKPGITGLAQVRGWRGETDTLEKMQKRVECDHEYIREWSLWRDTKILFQTAFVVLRRQNAY
jgi:putative colanic acid biosynthesis UDP-glucose lipid carrier transferase